MVGKGKDCVRQFRRFLHAHGGDGPLKDRDRDALDELERLGLATGEAYKIK